MTRLAPAFLALAVLLASASGAAAQGFNMGRDNDEQIQVYADDGMEWISEANRVVARGNAKAIRGTVTVVADTLTAYYRQGAKGNEIWRLDADGNVTISTPTETATGYKGTYDLDKSIFVLRGTPAKLVTPTDTVTAKDTLEYWELQRMAVARGDAFATSADKSIKADVLTAHFRDKNATPAPAKKPAAKSASGQSSQGSLELQRADAYGNVVLTTPQEVVTGDRGDYNLDTGIATVTGAVKLTRDGNELNGGFAHVNMNTGISKLFGAAPGGQGDSRARGTFIPEKRGKGDDKGDDGGDGDAGDGKGGEKRRAVFQGSGPSRQDNDQGATTGAGRR